MSNLRKQKVNPFKSSLGKKKKKIYGVMALLVKEFAVNSESDPQEVAGEY